MGKGRTSVGQAIFFDDVIADICNDMEIFEEQKNDKKSVVMVIKKQRLRRPGMQERDDKTM